MGKRRLVKSFLGALLILENSLKQMKLTLPSFCMPLFMKAHKTSFSGLQHGYSLKELRFFTVIP